MNVKQLCDYLHAWAPAGLAEDYDNPGLLCGNPNTEIQNVMVSLDATEEVVEEAAAKNCRLLISHHPVIFRGLKKLTGQNYAARTVEKAIRNDVALFAIHTNLDNTETGVNQMLAEKIGLKSDSLKILRPVKNRLIKLSYFVPVENHEAVLRAVHDAGGGQIGKYYDCSFSVEGRGRFTPGDGCDPTIGKIHQPEEVLEYKVDIIVPDVTFQDVLSRLREAHPYEELAYFASPVVNEWAETGAGMIGILPNPLPVQDFIAQVKSNLNLQVLRHTRITKETVEKIAICGGAGHFLIQDARTAGADVFLTSDLKYHEFFDAENQLILMDAGHYETEQFTSEGIVRKLSAQFPNIAVLLSETRTNPVYYA